MPTERQEGVSISKAELRLPGQKNANSLDHVAVHFAHYTLCCDPKIKIGSNGVRKIWLHFFITSLDEFCSLCCKNVTYSAFNLSHLRHKCQLTLVPIKVLKRHLVLCKGRDIVTQSIGIRRLTANNVFVLSHQHYLIILSENQISGTRSGY